MGVQTGIKHAFVPPGIQGADPSMVSKNEWLADHTGLVYSPDYKPASPHALDDEFETLSGWTTLGSLDVLNVTDVASHVHLKKTNSGGIVMDGIYKSCPQIPFTFTAKLTAFARDAYYKCAGIFIGDGAPGKMHSMYLPYTSTNGGRATYDESTWASRTSRSSIAEAYIDPISGGWPQYLRMVVTSGTSMDMQYSMDGLIWVTVWAAQNPGMGTPTVAGLWISGLGAVGAEAYFDWVRFNLVP